MENQYSLSAVSWMYIVGAEACNIWWTGRVTALRREPGSVGGRSWTLISSGSSTGIIQAGSVRRQEVIRLLFSTVQPDRNAECVIHFQVMSALGEEIKGIIVRALPNLSEETQLQLISRLQSSGLESKEDLKYVQQEDMADLLPVIQLRKLLDAFKSETEMFPLDLTMTQSPRPLSSSSPLETTSPLSSPSSLPSTSSSNLSEMSSPDSRGFPSQISKTWPETFQVPWDHMPLEIRSAIANGKRPTPAERRQMVRVLADEMRKHEANPTCSQFLTVCQKIVRQYPQSFADVFTDGSLMAGGHTSLLIQIKTRIENLNRDSSFARHRTPRRSGSSSVRKRGPTDTYGCTRFQPDLPPGETDDSVEQKRQRLEEIHRQEGASGVERAEVCSLMETTFCLLRRHIQCLVKVFGPLELFNLSPHFRLQT
ncbi:uncharacterized protein LOC127535415 [Acanthochromis polyacanthus]|uniref:uncharacterized protein LOC127535415 n=1 Tax=Acanthochromis polyacanthus TaxID=80966 RepID=UPI00223428DC|nr:uncharacterized protein LOC127535415 [Acanthochromis polyacanthus]